MRSTLSKHEVVRGLVDAVAEAHRHGIYHRDLKPANILLTEPPDVQAKIVDFGLGRLQRFPETSAASKSRLLQVGTPMYWPPEPPTLQEMNQYDPQSDVFAIGVVWYQLLTEKLERPPYDFITELQGAGVDSHTIQLIAGCLAHPERRFASACELDEEMEQFVPPDWDVPEGLFDVQHIVREYLGNAAIKS